MTPPNLRTLLLGSRFTAPPIMLACAFLTYRWWIGGAHGIIGFLTVGLLIASAKAASDVAAHRRWRADWEAMSPPAQPEHHSRRRPIMRLIAAAIIVGFYVYAWRLHMSPATHYWLALSAMLVAALGAGVILVSMVKWVMARARRSRPQTLVKVAVKGFFRHVPSVSECYQNLPDYCQQLLRGQD